MGEMTGGMNFKESFILRLSARLMGEMGAFFQYPIFFVFNPLLLDEYSHPGNKIFPAWE